MANQNVENGQNSDNQANASDISDVNMTILSELRSLSGRISNLEARAEATDATSPVSSRTSSRRSEIRSQDMVVPSIQAIKDSSSIQHQIDSRLRELSASSQQGKFKSQRGGTDTVWVKAEVKWPQNHILTGSAKSRPTYDSLSLSQWVSGFVSINRDEQNHDTKDQMLEYMADLMDDCTDFGWTPAKAAHAVLLCKMEEDKISWDQTDRIDRVRRVHAQKVSSSNIREKATM